MSEKKKVTAGTVTKQTYAKHTAAYEAQRDDVYDATDDLMSAMGARSAALIASNPPYVPQTDRSVLQREVVEYEPHLALFGGPDGLDIYRRLIADAERYGANSLLLMMSLGAMPQDVFLKQLRRFAKEVLPKLQAHQITRVPAAA